MDGFHGWYAASSYGLQSWFDYEKPKSGFFNVSGNATYNGSNIAVSINTTSLVSFPSGNLTVQIALVEDKTFLTPPGSNGEKYFPAVMRKMFPSASGNTIGTPTDGQANNFSFNYTYSSSQINVANCRVVVFIQDENDKYVYQSFSTSLVPVGMEEKTKVVSAMLIYPNPSAGNTTIDFNLVKNETVSVNVVNLLGESVYALAPVYMQEGENQLQLQMKDLPAGIYFVNLNAGSTTLSRKISVAK